MKKTRRTGYRAGTIQEKIWNALRIMRRCSYSDLEATAGAKPETVRAYVAILVRANYLAREGTLMAPVFTLRRNTGPLAPTIRPRGGLKDWNTGEIFNGRENELVGPAE